MKSLTDFEKSVLACLIGTVVGSVVLVAFVMIFIRA